MQTVWRYFIGCLLSGLAAYGAYEAYESAMMGQHMTRVADELQLPHVTHVGIEFENENRKAVLVIETDLETRADHPGYDPAATQALAAGVNESINKFEAAFDEVRFVPVPPAGKARK